jgi:hypothetical protein
MEFLSGAPPNESAETVRYQNGVEEEEEEEEDEGLEAGAALSAVQQYVVESWQRAEDSSLVAQPAILRANLQADLAALRAAAAAEASSRHAGDTTREEEGEEVVPVQHRNGLEETILSPEAQKKVGKHGSLFFWSVMLPVLLY